MCLKLNENQKNYDILNNTLKYIDRNIFMVKLLNDLRNFYNKNDFINIVRSY